MELLVRKIERAKWEKTDIRGGAPVSADAITICLRTKGNRLSFWRVPDETRVSDAVLAMTTAGDSLDTADFAVLPLMAAVEAGLCVEQTAVDTRVPDLMEAHHDATCLNYVSLGAVASLIVEAFRNDAVQRFTSGALKRLLLDALSSKRVSMETLDENLQRKLRPSG